jgi:hypothetical protein
MLAAVLIEEDMGAVCLAGLVALVPLTDLHSILQAGASALLDGQAQTLRGRQLSLDCEASQLFGGAFGYMEHGALLWATRHEVK